MGWGGVGVLLPLDRFGLGALDWLAVRHKSTTAGTDVTLRPLRAGARLGRWRDAEVVTDCPSNGTFWVAGLARRPGAKSNTRDPLCQPRQSLPEVGEGGQVGLGGRLSFLLPPSIGNPLQDLRKGCEGRWPDHTQGGAEVGEGPRRWEGTSGWEAGSSAWFSSGCQDCWSERSALQLCRRGAPGDRRRPRPFSAGDLRAFVMQMAAGG